MILIIDNYDSFTYNLYQMIASKHEGVEVIRNDALTFDQIKSKRPKSIILSPGPGRPEDSGVCLDVIRKGDTIPILGVCLGHQAIGYCFGGEVEFSPKVVHGKDVSVFHSRHKLFEKVSLPFTAGRYHSLIISRNNLPSVLSIEAETADGEIMAISHRERPCFGVQFHPESILTPEGSKILDNFLAL